jgi:hypothetical protein
LAIQNRWRTGLAHTMCMEEARNRGSSYFVFIDLYKVGAVPPARCYARPAVLSEGLPCPARLLDLVPASHITGGSDRARSLPTSQQKQQSNKSRFQSIIQCRGNEAREEKPGAWCAGVECEARACYSRAQQMCILRVQILLYPGTVLYCIYSIYCTVLYCTVAL